MWTTARIDWFLAEDSDEEFVLEEPLGLVSLRYQYVRSGADSAYKGGGLFGRSCVHHAEERCTLLSAVYLFLHGPLTDDEWFDLGKRSGLSRQPLVL